LSLFRNLVQQLIGELDILVGLELILPVHGILPPLGQLGVDESAGISALCAYSKALLFPVESRRTVREGWIKPIDVVGSTDLTLADTT
jgi:hypothetical protein